MICIFIPSGMVVQPTILETILVILELTMEYVVGMHTDWFFKSIYVYIGPDS